MTVQIEHVVQNKKIKSSQISQNILFSVSPLYLPIHSTPSLLFQVTVFFHAHLCILRLIVTTFNSLQFMQTCLYLCLASIFGNISLLEVPLKLQDLKKRSLAKKRRRAKIERAKSRIKRCTVLFIALCFKQQDTHLHVHYLIIIAPYSPSIHLIIFCMSIDWKSLLLI